MGEQLRDQVFEGIVRRAAELLAEHRGPVTMAQVAAAAGVGRATLYRYFPTRAALLVAISRAALDDLSAAVTQADLDAVSGRAAIDRLTRALVGVGRRYGALTRAGDGVLDRDDLDRRVTHPLRGLLERAVADGTLRADLPIPTLFTLFVGLVDAAVTDRETPAESAAAAVASVFLDGAARTVRP
jgi:AcrR family transcriptional regulator